MSGHLEWNPLKYGDIFGIIKPGGQFSNELTDKLDSHGLKDFTHFHNDIAPWIAAAFASYGALGGGAAAGGGGGAVASPVLGGGGPEIAGFATGADPFVSASGGSLMGAPGSMPAAASSGMGWQQYARMANMGSNLMNGGSQQQQPMQTGLQTGPHGVLMSPTYMPDMSPVYPGALSPFIRRT